MRDAEAVYVLTHGKTPPEVSLVTDHHVAELSWLIGSATFESVRAAVGMVTSALSDIEPRVESVWRME